MEQIKNCLKLDFPTGFPTGLAWIKPLYFRTEGLAEHCDIMKLIDGYFEFCKDNEIEHGFQTFDLQELYYLNASKSELEIFRKTEEAEEYLYKTYISSNYLPINGGEFYIYTFLLVEYLTEDELLETLCKEALDKSYQFKKVLNDKGFTYYETEIYADYRDEMNEETVKEILSYKHPKDHLYETLFNWYAETECDMEADIIKEICDYINRKYPQIYEEFELDCNSNDLLDIVRDLICINYPYDHYLNQEFNTVIFVDTGNYNYDCTCDNLLNYYSQSYNNNAISGVYEESTLLNLAKWQGYTKEEFIDAVLNDGFKFTHLKENKFFNSIIQEAVNLASHMGTLVFLTKMTLRELIELNTDKDGNTVKDRAIITDINNINNEHKQYPDLKISKETMCGLFDNWSGGGSCLEIELEKDFVLKSEYIHHIGLDGSLGHGVDDVYGLCGYCWDGKVEIIKEKK